MTAPDTVDALPTQGVSAVGGAAAGDPSPPPPEQPDSIDVSPAIENVRKIRNICLKIWLAVKVERCARIA